ncbi:hypothetical protein CK203_095635 [Vitis vinifera]|uniref:Uncharacterized protein n=1 Tax=Vitis vinifera TaxID=29760 RepID=A0A438EMI0_VITVI|nr:hypothetical protein CK203_095635 [Vitis vinifera]
MALVGPEVWHFYRATSRCLSSNQDLWTARTSSSSIEYLFARLNKSSIVVGGFLASDSKNGVPGQMPLEDLQDSIHTSADVCLCRAEHKYCPTKASDRGRWTHRMWRIWARGIPWGLVMNDMRERRGEHVVQPFADGANGWLIWEVSPRLSSLGVTIGSGCASQAVAAGGLGLLGSLESELSSQGARCMGVCGSCGLTLLVSGMALAVPRYIDSDSSLEFAIWPLERWRREGPSMKSGCVAPRFLLLTFLSPGGEFAVAVRLPTVFFDGLAPFRMIFFFLTR